MAAGKSSRVNRQYKTKCRIRNWREYERGLRSRGNVTIWLSEEAIAAWTPAKNGLRAGQRRYSNLAILTALTLRVVYRLPLRQSEGYPRSPSEYQLGTVFCAGLNFGRQNYSFGKGRARAVEVGRDGQTPRGSGFSRLAEAFSNSLNHISFWLSMAEGVHLQYVVRQANHCPFTLHFLEPA